MPDFERALGVILDHETEPGSTDGSYTDRPTDKGGPTKWGVTQATLASWRGHPVSAEDVRVLPREEAALIYRARYWQACSCPEIQDQEVATKIFDVAVNCGPHRAGELLQRAVNRCQPAPHTDALLEDGAIGPKTLAAANACKPCGVLDMARSP